MYTIYIIFIGHKKSLFSDNHYFVPVRLRERWKIKINDRYIMNIIANFSCTGLFHGYLLQLK